jgi:hypothetical protein
MSREAEIARLARLLADEDGVVREQARNELIQLGGHDVACAMVATLIDHRAHVRWEAAKTLQVIADPVAAASLMNVLDDDDSDVRWVAAEALVALGRVGLLTVLSGLTKRAGSILFSRSAHHVLHEMQTYGDPVARVLGSLEESDPGMTVPPVAYKALIALNEPLNVA